MFFRTRAVVLREADYKDNDRILTLLTEDRGLLTAKACGVKGKSSKLKAACQLFAFSEFTVFENRGYHTLREATTIELFAALRDNVERYALAAYVAQTAEILSQEDSPSQLPLLVLHAFHALCGTSDTTLIKSAYELRLCALTGFEPDVSVCRVCENETPNRFDVANGSLICAACRNASDDGLFLSISPGALHAMRYVLNTPISRVFRFKLSEHSTKELYDVSETYLLQRLERSFSTLDFYKSLQLT